jgi:hypothetical protein
MIKFLIFFLGLSVVAYGQTTTKQKTENNPKQISTVWDTLDGADYTIQHPGTWQVNTDGMMGATFFITSPIESEDDKFSENVNLIKRDLMGFNLNLDLLAEMSEKQINAMITNIVWIENKRIKGDKGEYHTMIYSGVQGIYRLRYEQRYWIIGNKMFVLTLTMQEDNTGDLMETSQKILNSFIIKIK